MRSAIPIHKPNFEQFLALETNELSTAEQKGILEKVQMKMEKEE